MMRPCRHFANEVAPPRRPSFPVNQWGAVSPSNSHYSVSIIHRPILYSRAVRVPGRSGDLRRLALASAETVGMAPPCFIFATSIGVVRSAWWPVGPSFGGFARTPILRHPFAAHASPTLHSPLRAFSPSGASGFPPPAVAVSFFFPATSSQGGCFCASTSSSPHFLVCDDLLLLPHYPHVSFRLATCGRPIRGILTAIRPPIDQSGFPPPPILFLPWRFIFSSRSRLHCSSWRFLLFQTIQLCISRYSVLFKELGNVRSCQFCWFPASLCASTFPGRNTLRRNGRGRRCLISA